jgi:HemY protein
MIRRGLWFFLQLAVLVIVAVWLAEQPGAVSVEWRGWLLETSFGILVLLVIVLAALGALLWWVWRSIKGTPHAIGRYRLHRRRTKGYAALVRSLSAVAAGDARAALDHASNAEEIGEPALAHLAAAEAAEMVGDIPRARAEYVRLRDRPDTALIGLRGLIGLAETAGDLKAAIDLARQARKLSPKSPWMARRLFELETRAQAFADAERTLADATKLGAFSQPESDLLLARLLLSRAEAAEAAGHEADALTDAERAHQLDPSLGGAADLGIRLLVRAGRIPAAERMVMQSWSVAPSTTLARAWMALAPAGDVAARLKQAERLHALDRDNVEGRLALAEAELAAGRWGEARAHLAALSDLPPGAIGTRRYARLMAYLESASGHEAAAKDWFDKSLAPAGI